MHATTYRKATNSHTFSLLAINIQCKKSAGVGQVYISQWLGCMYETQPCWFTGLPARRGGSGVNMMD